jgi:two-component system chemotaxis response regulator CheY
MRRRVLIADDSRHIRLAVRELLESAGFDICSEAENGALAVEQAEQLKPDLIVLDLAMPVMNGLQAAPILRKMLPAVPILLFTLYSNSALEQTALAAGVTSVLSKSESAQTLVRAVRTLLAVAA